MVAFPDLHTAVVEIFAADDRVAVHRRWTGTHAGTFQGIEPRGRPVGFEPTDILTFRDGRIAEYHGVLDMLALVAQLGASRGTSF